MGHKIDIQAEWRRCKTHKLYPAFNRFHEANPHVYDTLCALADKVISRGATRWGIANLYEVARWEAGLITHTPTEQMFPNNHKAFYARLWLLEHPDHPDFFQLCEMRAANDNGIPLAASA